MSEECDSFNSWELNGLNSLDLWDYTVELECLQGSQAEGNLNFARLFERCIFGSQAVVAL